MTKRKMFIKDENVNKQFSYLSKILSYLKKFYIGPHFSIND